MLALKETYLVPVSVYLCTFLNQWDSIKLAVTFLYWRLGGIWLAFYQFTQRQTRLKFKPPLFLKATSIMTFNIGMLGNENNQLIYSVHVDGHVHTSFTSGVEGDKDLTTHNVNNTGLTYCDFKIRPLSNNRVKCCVSISRFSEDETSYYSLTFCLSWSK